MNITERLQDLPDAELVNHLMTHTTAPAVLRSHCGSEEAQILQVIRQRDAN